MKRSSNPWPRSLVLVPLILLTYLSSPWAGDLGKGVGVKVIWLGQAGFKITSPQGKVILIDPWVEGNTLFPFKDPEGKNDLTPLLESDLLLITHGHLDHLGDTIPIANHPSAKSGLKILSIFEIMTYLWEQGVPKEKLLPMNKGGSLEIEGITVTMVNAIHSSGIGSFAPKSLANGGEAAGFIIRLENGYTIYHAGDTSIFGDMKLYSTLYRPDLALLPIGGRFTMGPEDAALATVLLSPRVVIPMHFGGTFQLPGDPNRFRDSVFKRLQKKVKVIIPTPGKVIE